MALAIGGSVIGSLSNGATSGNTTTQTSGSVLVVATCFLYDQVWVNLTDNYGNTFTSLTGMVPNGSTGTAELFYCANASGGANHNFTVSFNGLNPCLLMAAEITGWAVEGQPDRTTSWLVDTLTPFVSNETATTRSDEEMALAFAWTNGTVAETFTWGNGFTLIASQTASIRGSFAYKALSSKQAVQSSLTLNDGTIACSNVVTFREFTPEGIPLFYWDA